MLTFRRRINSKVGLFFVWKKNGTIRLIVDARSTNLKHKPPPRVQLGSVAALAEVDLSAFALERAYAADAATGARIQSLAVVGGIADVPFSLSSLDVEDGFPPV